MKNVLIPRVVFRAFSALVATIAVALVALSAQATQPGVIEFIDYDYIESPGTAYIDTEYVPNSKTEIEMEFSFTEELAAKAYVFGVYSSNGGRFQFSYGPDTTGSFLGYGSLYQSDVPGLQYDTSRHVVRYVPGGGFYFDGDLVTTATVDLKTWSGTSLNLDLGGLNANGTHKIFSPIRIYSCKIKESDVLIRDLVPKLRVSDGKSGLYDNVAGNFYCGSNADFTAGLILGTAPRLFNGSLSLSGGTYTVGAILTNGAANVSYVLSNGSTVTTNAVGSYANGDTVSATFAAPTDNTTYEVVLTAENAAGETDSLSLGTIYGGTLALTKVSDGNELGCVPATLTVSRTNPDPLPLVVNYSFTPDTAVAGVNYVDDAGSVTIPAGATSVTITVTPLVDMATTTDTSLTVSIADGNYAAPAGVEVTIACVPDPTTLVYSSELTFPAAPATALENFPVLVRISTTAPAGFLYEVCPNASHLWFTDDGGAPLPFEVDTWDTTGTSLVWVSVPSLSSSTAITMHWAGDTGNVPDEIPASREVWTRAGYRAVWHFSGSAAESVTNLAATAVGSPTYNGNASYPGPLGKTLWLNGSSHLYFANDPSWATIGENSTLTISCWARATAAG